MTNIEMILKIMSQDLNDYQLAKLKNVLEALLKSTKNAPSNNILIEQFVQNKKLIGMKDTSITSYVFEIRKLADFYPDKNLTTLTTGDLKEYLRYYMDVKHLASSTIQLKIRIMSSFYDVLVNDEYIEKNPTLKIGKVMVEKKLKTAFSVEELNRIRDACDNTRDRAFIEFLYSTGCRISEVLALNVKDLNFETRSLIVFGKGHKERVVYMSNICIEWIRKYIEERGFSYDSEAPLFSHITKYENRITIRDAQLLLKNLGTIAHVENVHPHRFRRTMATHAMDRGMPIEQIKEILGHSRIDTTMIYCNVNSHKTQANFYNIFNDESNTLIGDSTPNNTENSANNK